MQSEIVQAVNALIKSGNEEGNPLTLPGFQTTDIYPIFEHAFTEKAKTCLALPATSLIHQYNDIDYHGRIKVLLGKLRLQSCVLEKDLPMDDMWVRRYDLVHYAALRAAKENLPKAIERVIEAVNYVAEKNFTRASLVKLSIVEAARSPESLDTEYIVVSYITLNDKGAVYVANNMSDIFIKEGGMPMRVE